jgi:predicted transposase
LQSLPIRLETNEEEKILLLDTMSQYDKAANFVAEKAFEWKITNKYQLQKLRYRQIREQFSLSAQFTIRVINKVAEAYRRDINIKPVFREFGAIQYDQRNLSWKGFDGVSRASLKGRIKLDTRINDYQRAKTGSLKGQADLVYRNGTFYLIAVIDAHEGTLYESQRSARH